MPNNDRLSSIFPVLEVNAKIAKSTEKIVEVLNQGRTLRMQPNPNGIFPASSGQDPNAPHGMQNAWIRDNVFVAYSLFATGSLAEAKLCCRSLLQFAVTQAERMDAIVRNPALKKNTQERPHIRFCTETLKSTDQLWSHAQNDAWGYLAWLVTELACEGGFDLTREDEDFLALLTLFFKAITYYADEDNGTWEEDAKVNTSSIAACIAALRGIARYAHNRGSVSSKLAAVLPTIESQINQGLAVLAVNLPFETPSIRHADAALLFSIYPLNIVTNQHQQDLVLSLIQARLLGPYGIRRYVGDSYYCQDYDKWFSPRQRSNDNTFSNTVRNQFLTPGLEAQWCLFDPILSVIYAQRYLKSGDITDFARQLRFANRALGQVTNNLQCPEMYFCSEGEWIPNPHTPLLWTQANLAIAINMLNASAVEYSRRNQKRATYA